MPKVSVIVPVYNSEKTLNRCLDALLAQSHKNIEIICVNDGSNDSSLEILNEYNKRDPRIVVLEQENSGPAKARNYAISKMTGEYLMFCDADDWYEPKMVETMVNTIMEQKVDIVMCDCNVIDLANGQLQNENAKNYHHLKKEGFVNLSLKNLDYINNVLWNKIFSKKFLEENNIKYPSKYLPDDVIFIYKILAVAKTYYGIEDKLYNYIVGNPNSVMGKVFTGTNKKHEFDFCYCFDEIYAYLNEHKVNNEILSLYMCKNYAKARYYYTFLEKKNRKTAYEVFKNFIKEHSFLLENENFNKLYNSKNFIEFDRLLSKGFRRNTFLENIFSVRNINSKKVITILGIKIKKEKVNVLDN